jgi:peptide chain release factor 2
MQAKLFKLEREKQQKVKNEMYDAQGEIAWGNQIRNYVFTPYQMIKDTRTGVVRHDVNQVLNGDVHGFMEEAVLKFGNMPKD